MVIYLNLLAHFIHTTDQKGTLVERKIMVTLGDIICWIIKIQTWSYIHKQQHANHAIEYYSRIKSNGLLLSDL